MLSYLRNLSNKITSLKIASNNFSKVLEKSSYSTTCQVKCITPKTTYNPYVVNFSAKNDLNINIGNRKVPLPAIDIPTVKDVIDTTVYKSPLIDNINNNIGPIEMPNNSKVDDTGIQAARLIVIRRRKMKKHKLRKLRKKMKFEWAKIRQRREMRKEKAFQAVLIAQIKEAEKFSAEEYVAEKIRKATDKEYWKKKNLE